MNSVPWNWHIILIHTVVQNMYTCTVQCSTVQYSAVQCSTVQYSAVQCSITVFAWLQQQLLNHEDTVESHVLWRFPLDCVLMQCGLTLHLGAS